jgi:hypothetical protein
MRIQLPAKQQLVGVLKVPKREIFDRSDFPDFYTIKSSWVGDLVVKILTYYFNFSGSYAAFVSDAHAALCACIST